MTGQECDRWGYANEWKDLEKAVSAETVPRGVVEPYILFQAVNETPLSPISPSSAKNSPMAVSISDPSWWCNWE